MPSSVKVQNDHYAQVDDHHFDRFNQAAAESVAQKTPETTGTGANDKKKPRKNTWFLRGFS